MTDGSQSDIWRARYEHLWAGRAEIARRMIAQGETQPMRIIQSIERLERRFELISDGAKFHWEKRKSDPKSNLPSGIPAFRNAAFNGGPVQVSAYTYANLPHFIADFFAEAGPFDAVVELGCGFGQNLFKLDAAGIPDGIRYFGGELSAAGIELGRMLAALDRRLAIEFFPFDHLEADMSPVRGASNPLVFTCHSLEQVNEVSRSFFAAVAGCASRVTCIHLEPFGFQIRMLGQTARAQRRFFEEQHWNRNLHTAAEQAEKDGVIKRTVLIPEIFLSTDEINVTSLMVWTSGNPQ